ncbi:MAG: class I SAM-dependent RNA methyltransferase [Bacteroidia bacterium]
MSIFETQADLLITCYKRLGPFLDQELRTLGYVPSYVSESMVRVPGTATDAMLLNMKLRTASQILYPLLQFDATEPEQVYDALKRYPFERLLMPEGYFSVSSHVKHPSVNNPMFINMKVKDAIVDRMRDKTGRRPNTGSEFRGAVLHLYWVGEQATLYTDTSGETIARHGYRLHPGKAPLLESIAAAMILATGWESSQPLLNPMGGVGTLAIEAACMATQRYPGLYRRRYAFQHLQGYKERDYLEALLDLEDLVQEVEMPKIVVNDRDTRMLSFALQNAEKAGVRNYIETVGGDFRELSIPEATGWAILNPEYGERLGEIDQLTQVYGEIGSWMKHSLPGWKVGLISGNLELLSKIGLKPDRRIPLFNGRIDSRFCLYSMYAGTKREF